MKKYSFIIPHYNGPVLLKRLIDSIPQRYDVEIIVVDDNSVEGQKPNICRSDVSIFYLDNSNSNGAGHARNVGIEIASGEWLLFADSDDYYEPDLLTYLDAYCCDSSIDVIVFNANVVNRKNGEKTHYLDKEYDVFHKDSSNNAARKLLMSSSVPWNKIYRKNFIDLIQARFEEIPFGNDVWFTQYSAYNAKRIEVSDARIYDWEINEGGITSTKRPMGDYLRCISTHRRVNRMKYKLGFYDLIAVNGLFKYSLTKNYPYRVYLFISFYRIITDISILKVLFRRLF